MDSALKATDDVCESVVAEGPEGRARRRLSDCIEHRKNVKSTETAVGENKYDFMHKNNRY